LRPGSNSDILAGAASLGVVTRICSTESKRIVTNFSTITLMPVKPRTRITLLRIAAIIFALNAIFALAAAYEAHQRNEKARTYIARTVLYASLCIVFLNVSRIRRKAIQADEDASQKNPNDHNA
jgi:hypothetical protein